MRLKTINIQYIIYIYNLFSNQSKHTSCEFSDCKYDVMNIKLTLKIYLLTRIMSQNWSAEFFSRNATINANLYINIHTFSLINNLLFYATRHNSFIEADPDIEYEVCKAVRG